MCKKLFGIAALVFGMQSAVHCQFQSTNHGFVASGSISLQMGELSEKGFRQTFHVTYASFDNGWWMKLGSPPIAIAVWDGTNQYVLNTQISSSATNNFALVHSDEVPHGGGYLRSLWFGMRLRSADLVDGMPFPNLLSYMYPPAKTNTILRLVRAENGDIQSARIKFPFQTNEFVTVVLDVASSTNIAGKWTPTEFNARTYSRLGVEIPRGYLNLPQTGADFSNVLEEVHVKLLQFRALTPDDLSPGIDRFAIANVIDERIGGGDFPLTYLATNRIPNENELRADNRLKARIRSLEIAENLPPQSKARQSSKARLIVLGLLLFPSAALLLFALRRRVWRKTET